MASTTRQRGTATRSRILNATRAAVVHRGLSEISMVDIAREAQVGRTTLYRHWPDLRSLTTELFTHEIGLVLSEVDFEVNDGDEVCALILGLATALRDNPIVDALRRHEPELVANYIFTRMGSTQQNLVATLSAILERVSQEDERLSISDPLRTSAMVLLLVQGAVLSAPTAKIYLSAATWHEELDRAIRGYLGL